MKRRVFLMSTLALAAPRAFAAATFPDVVAGRPIVLPRDHGSHPSFRTEWWYITGSLRDAAGVEMGVQLTFFRSRPGIADESASRFAPRQLLFAHAAVAAPARGHLLYDQRAARTGFGLAEAADDTTRVRLGNWSLARDGDVYNAAIDARDFALRLAFRTTQPLLLQGDAGVSRKGPQAAQASYYYSIPQLAVTGTLTVDGRPREVTGTAWLDHEWSSEYLAPDARGWDWTGINFDDGSALMAFRIRRRDGSVLWAGGSHRDAAGHRTVFGPADVRFDTARRWRSPRTSIEYPVAVRVVAGEIDVMLEPLQDDQELDARASVGTVYWEGAVRASSGGRIVGRGYLELTGYGEPLKL